MRAMGSWQLLFAGASTQRKAAAQQWCCSAMGNAQGAGVRGAESGVENTRRGGLDIDGMLSEWECMPCKVSGPCAVS